MNDTTDLLESQASDSMETGTKVSSEEGPPAKPSPWGRPIPVAWWLHAAVLLGGTAALGYVYRSYYNVPHPPMRLWWFDVCTGLLTILYVGLAFRLPAFGREIQALVVMTAAVFLGRYFGHLMPFFKPGVQLLGLRPAGPRDCIMLNWLLGSVPYLLGIPSFYVLFVWRKRLSASGVCLGDWRVWVRWLAFAVLVMPPVLWFQCQRDPELRNFYPMVVCARTSTAAFLVYQLLITLLMFGWEFSLRGFLQFALEARLGLMAVVVQDVPFVLGHVRKPESELYGTLVSGLFLGLAAFRGRSMVPAFVIHLFVAVAMDVVALIQNGVLRLH